MSGFLFNAFIVFSVWMIAFSCNTLPSPTEKPIAQASVNTLYLSEITPIMPVFTDSLDSVNWLTNYIDNWTKEQIILDKARFNLPDEKINFEKEVENYRNSLIRHLYEKELIRKYLDTIVSTEAIENYYEQNKNNFILRSHIVRFSYLKLHHDLKQKQVKQLKDVFKNKGKENWIDLEHDCFKYKIQHQLFDTVWYNWSQVEGSLNIDIENEINWLKYNRYAEFEDSTGQICLKIHQYKLSKDFSPLQFEKEKIKKIIIHQRKIELLKRLENEIYQDAKEKGEIKRYF